MSNAIKSILQNKLVLVIQRILLGIHTFQMGFLSFNYFQDSFANKFPVFEKLFTPAIVNACTSSGCWQSLTPFLASTYLAITLLSLVAAIFFRAGRELRLVLFVTASMHIMMGYVRLYIVPNEFYTQFTALKASQAQFIFGGLILIAASLPYSKKNE